MAGTITHKWEGTVLTITSDSGTSSMDLQGNTGNTGPRGPQGPAGILIGENGVIDLDGYATTAYVDAAVANVDVDLTNYYTKNEVNNLIPNVSGYITQEDIAGLASKSYVDAAVADVEVDLTGYATETYVSTKIAEAQLSGDNNDIDLSGYATKDDIPTKTSQLTNDSGFLTKHQSLTNYYTKSEVNAAIAAIPETDLTNYYTKSEVDAAIAAAINALDGDGVSY